MTAVATPDAARLVFAAVAGLILLLILIIKFKVHAMISILIGAVGIGLMAGMPLSDIIGSVNEGIGNTLKGIALLVGLGSMFGAILEESGGAQTLAVTMVRKFGDEKAAWALGITGLVVAMPVFFDAGLIILIPLAFSLAKRTKRSVLYYVIPLLAGLAVGHAFIPPTPGPVLVASMLGVDLGWVILIGIFCGIFAMIAAGPIWGSICGKKYMIEVPEHVAQQADIDESKLPKFGTIVGIILIPLVLIIANSVAKVVPALAGIQPVLAFLGEPFMALLLATIAAMYLLGTRHGYNNAQLEKIMTKSLEPTGMILLVTACGGVLRYMLQNSGLGDVIGNAVANASLPLVLVAFIVAALVRISVGSATVAMTMAAGIISAMPGLSELSPLYLACVTAAIAGGSTVCSHFNDSGFWLVKSLVGMDEKTTLKTWTIMETLVGGVGFLVARIHAHNSISNDGVDVLNSLGHALAQIAALVAVPQLQSFKLTSGCAGRCAAACHSAVGQSDLRFHGGVAAGVQDLAAYNRFNFQIVHLENLLNIISFPVLPGAGRRVTANYDSYV